MKHQFKKLWPQAILLLIIIVGNLISATAGAHHVLGRPAYGLNEDSNTPSSMHVETQVGDYEVTYMIFPAFPRPHSPGRINLYARRLDTGVPYEGEVSFSVQSDSWFGSTQEQLGTQSPDDTVFRQGFVFSEKGDYVITARFEASGEHHAIDFPLRVGDKSLLGPLGMAVGLVLILLICVKLIQRKRLLRETIRDANRQST